MRVIGFNFTKINIERVNDPIKDMKLNSNIDIKSIEELKPEFLKIKQNTIKVIFTYTLDYTPDVAKIEIGGSILIALDQKQSKEILNGWTEKNIPNDLKIMIFNLILRKANLKALELEDELNLPLHIPLPHVGKQEENK